MVALVSPTARCRQRYVNGCRLVAGCIPYRYSESCDACKEDAQGRVEVLMVTPHRGKGLLFPKGGWETNETIKQAAHRETLEEAGVKGIIKDCLGSWDFTSKRCRDEHGSRSKRKVYVYLLHVTEQLESWPEKDVRQRKWVKMEDAMELCKKLWMRKALERCTDFFKGGYTSSLLSVSADDSASDSPSHILEDEEHSEKSACEEMVPECEDDNVASDDDILSFTTEENTSSSSD